MQKKAENKVLTTRVTLLTSESDGAGKQKKFHVVQREPKAEQREPKAEQKKPEAEQRKSEKEQTNSEVIPPAGSFAAELIFSLLLLAAVCAFRTVLVYANNTDLISFSDVAKPMWIYMFGSIAAFALLRIIFRRPYFACMFVAFGVFLFINLDWLIAFLRLFISEYRPAAIGSLILCAVLLVGFFFLLRMLYRKKIRLHAAVNILAATFTCLVLFNVVTAFMAVGHAASKDKPEPAPVVVAEATHSPAPSRAASPTAAPTTSAAAVSQEFGLPNIYFFILDEFSSFDMLQKYYGYDAKPFNDYLVSAGFNVSSESYGTDNQTEHVICDLMNLDYISKPLSKEECVEAIYDGELHQILTGLGYSEYQLANSTYFKGIESLISGDSEERDNDEPSNKTDFGDVGVGDITGGLGGILGELLKNPDPETQVDSSALNKFGFYPSEYIRNSTEYKEYKNKSDDARSKIRRADGLLKKFDFLQDASNFAGINTPHVTYCYLLATHVPFVFNEYGGIIPHSQNRNWEDTDVYLNQYKYINKQLIATMSSIITNDPDSIIIIMSDHGIRHHAESNLKLKHKFYITNKDSCRIMNAVYIKGQKHDVEGLSGTNTLRYVLSLYDGQDYSPIEDPITSDSPENLRGIIPRPR